MLNERSPIDEFTSAAQRVADLSQEFENLPYPQLRDKAADLLEAVDTLHRAPLERLVTILRAGGHAELLDRLSEDPIVRQLFLLYDLLPSDDKTRVEEALSSFREYAHAHGGDIEVEEVVDGVVTLRVSGACLACSRSTASLRHAIEEALRREYPGFGSLRIREVGPPVSATTSGSEAECPPCA